MSIEFPSTKWHKFHYNFHSVHVDNNQPVVNIVTLCF